MPAALPRAEHVGQKPEQRENRGEPVRDEADEAANHADRREIARAPDGDTDDRFADRLTRFAVHRGEVDRGHHEPREAEQASERLLGVDQSERGAARNETGAHAVESRERERPREDREHDEVDHERDDAHDEAGVVRRARGPRRLFVGVRELATVRRHARGEDTQRGGLALHVGGLLGERGGPALSAGGLLRERRGPALRAYPRTWRQHRALIRLLRRRLGQVQVVGVAEGLAGMQRRVRGTERLAAVLARLRGEGVHVPAHRAMRDFHHDAGAMLCRGSQRNKATVARLGTESTTDDVPRHDRASLAAGVRVA